MSDANRTSPVPTILAVLCFVFIAAGIIRVTWPRWPNAAGTKARIKAAQTQISTFVTVLNAYKQDTGEFPNGTNSLQRLLVNLPEVKNWQGPYLDSPAIPKDPWGNDYIYLNPSSHNTNSFDVLSAGPDGRAGTEDDITNWH